MVIVAAVDESDQSTEVIRQAKVLAEAFDDILHVVHVLTASEASDLARTKLDESGNIMNMDQVRKAAEEIANDVTEDLDVPYETIGLMGDPASRVVEYADGQDAQYIVVSGRKQSPTGKLIFGSVSQSILLNATCPVVSTIKQ